MPSKTRQPSRLPLWEKLLFSLLTTVCVLVLLEAGLAFFGVQASTRDVDPFVGFASNLPLFVPSQTGEDAVEMVTAENKRSLFNRQRFPENKPASSYRIFCMGGSTTYGRPYNDQTSFARWLREFLPLADSSTDWEVINAGGISYASYRVAALMDELSQYQPDLFIIYTGHNEFLERRTYRSLLETPGWLRNVHARLASLRTYRLLQESLGRGWDDSTAPVDGRDLLPAEVDTILDQSYGPDEYSRDDAFAAQVLEHYQLSLTRSVQLAREAGADVILVTCASNLRDFEPFKSQHREGLDADQQSIWLGYLDRAADAFQRREFAEALASLDTAAEIDDRHARLHFLRGRVLARLERWEEARGAFVRARDEDVCPLRGLTPMQQIVREVAFEQQVPLVDFATMIDELAEHRIPGDDWFLDHVHPTIEGHRRLALQLVETLQDRGVVKREAAWTPEAIEGVTADVLQSLDSRTHANALRNLAKVLGWAGKVEEASNLAIRAVEGLPGDREAHYLAGQAWHQREELGAAATEYLLALQADPDYVPAIVMLGAVLIEQEKPAAARNYLQRAVKLEPDRPLAHQQLGKALLQLNELPAAESAFRKCLEVGPPMADAYHGLGQVAVRQGHWEQAVSHLEAALDIRPEAPETHCELGFVFLEMGRAKDAADEFTLALLLDPDNERAAAGLERLDAAETNRNRPVRKSPQPDG